MEANELKYYRRAFALSLFTIFYNVVEGIVSMVLGYTDETLSLFGFGADSFIEVLSGIGIAVMVTRIRKHPESRKSGFELTALKITGTAFYLLSAGLFAGIILNIATGHSAPVIADANCTMVCVYMSVVLLISSLVYELTGFAYADVIGAAGLIYFSLSEGREAFEKARHPERSGCTGGECR